MTKRRRISNKAIVMLKIISALGLLFSCCLYLFMNFGAFKRDLGLDKTAPLGTNENQWYHLVFPVLLILGFCFVVYYVGNMIIRVETKQIWKADNLFILYHIVFTFLLLVTIWRWFLLDLSNAVWPSVIMIISGLINLCTPKIIDNDNQDF
ncbi:MAG: hypothetical protein MJ054_01035 [Clostridia bacterium]|nr:hypothetical protein [Clostridia bacterium]